MPVRSVRWVLMKHSHLCRDQWVATQLMMLRQSHLNISDLIGECSEIRISRFHFPLGSLFLASSQTGIVKNLYPVTFNLDDISQLHFFSPLCMFLRVLGSKIHPL